LEDSENRFHLGVEIRSTILIPRQDTYHVIEERELIVTRLEVAVGTDEVAVTDGIEDVAEIDAEVRGTVLGGKAPVHFAEPHVGSDVVCPVARSGARCARRQKRKAC